MLSKFKFFILFFCAASCKAQELKKGVSYVSEGVGSVTLAIVFYEDSTFAFRTNSPNLPIKEVYGVWEKEGTIVTLNSQVTSATPSLSCEKEYDVNLVDSVVFRFLYVDSSIVEGFIYPCEKDTNLLALVPLKKEVKIVKNEVVNKVLVDADFTGLLTLSVDFTKYNTYKCFLKPVQYVVFENRRYKIEQNKIVNVENKADFYELKE
jgi:hypothetical protein